MYLRIPALFCAILRIAANRRSAIALISKRKLVLPERIELSTSPLPRECSTTELRQQTGFGNPNPWRPEIQDRPAAGKPKTTSWPPGVKPKMIKDRFRAQAPRGRCVVPRGVARHVRPARSCSIGNASVRSLSIGERAATEPLSSGINSLHAPQMKYRRTSANLPGLRDARPQFVHRTFMLVIDIMSLRAADERQHQRDQSVSDGEAAVADS
jgi:hypothetical protein